MQNQELLKFRVTIREPGGGKEYRNCQLSFGSSPQVTQIIEGLTENVGIPNTQITFSRVTGTHLSNTAGQPEDVFAVGEGQEFANEDGDLFLRTDVRDIQHTIITPINEDDIFTAPRERQSKVVAWPQNSIEIDIRNSQIVRNLGGDDSGVNLYKEQGGNRRQFVKKRLSPNGPRDTKLIETEIVILKFLIHKNIVRYYTPKINQHDEEYVIYMEYVDGHSLNGIPRMSDEMVRNYTSQIVDAVTYLHDEALIHRDIRPSNVLINNQGIVKLKGFRSLRFTKYTPDRLRTHNSGISTYQDSGRTTYIAERRNAYKSPEMVRRKEYTAEGDVWCVGLLTLQMITGEEPWIGKNDAEIYNAMNNQAPPHGIYAGNISVEWNNFFSRVFNYNCNGRPTTRDLQEQLPFGMIV